MNKDKRKQIGVTIAIFIFAVGGLVLSYCFDQVSIMRSTRWGVYKVILDGPKTTSECWVLGSIEVCKKSSR